MRLFTSSRALLIAAVLAALSACASRAPAKPTPAKAMADSSCPVAVPGTSVTAEDTATGAALVFVTTGDVDELRQRVGAMATKHNQHQAKRAARPGMAPEVGGMAGMDPAGGRKEMMMMVPAAASAEDVTGGARIVLVAAPVDVEALRDHARKHATMMAGGTCMMMDAR